MNNRAWIILVSTVLTGCGSMPQDRAISGAGVGAGAGAIIGAVTGLSVLEGAALGATAGALTGVLTDERDVNLGDPAWKRGSAASGGYTDHGGYHDEAVASIQSGLNELGYQVGRVDGRMGPRTRDAIRAYQRDHGLLVDGIPTVQLSDHIRRNAG